MKNQNLKQLTTKYLASFWVLILVLAMGLQVASQFHSSASKSQNDSAETEIILATTSPAQPTSSNPDHQILDQLLQIDYTSLDILGPPSRQPGFLFHPLQKLDLMRLLMTTISINAP
ncbi:MAG TPA: hypothetical protein PKY12_04960 [Catalimonadaceae bacterium]|jgi:hypothetical protein|nr:hypothetical protein [Catalimonadaceae bacterium]